MLLSPTSWPGCAAKRMSEGYSWWNLSL
ncbi:unnamed protein product [Linum tenue]|uniref:Uncharacterized protein n=1 Tax=Linum tenue TaxID=586396 RepID=A0AAV0PVG7_9ROSI|nr:unnamed protein product [Linum tenue]